MLVLVERFLPMKTCNIKSVCSDDLLSKNSLEGVAVVDESVRLPFCCIQFM